MQQPPKLDSANLIPVLLTSDIGLKGRLALKQSVSGQQGFRDRHRRRVRSDTTWLSELVTTHTIQLPNARSVACEKGRLKLRGMCSTLQAKER